MPRHTRQWLRRAYDGLRFDAAMRRFIAAPADALPSANSLLSDLIEAWGNAGWIARDDYLRECLAVALESSGPTLECGSGLSTLLLGAVAQQRGYEHWVLEHLPEWGAKVERLAVRYRLRSMKLCTAPLKDYGGYTWYDPPLARLPHGFTLVVCDGPPAATTGGRYGLAPIMRDHLAPGCVILLDDAGREHERAIALRWQEELGARHQLVPGDNPYIRLTVPGPHPSPHASSAVQGS